MVFSTGMPRHQVALVLACLSCACCGGRPQNSQRQATSNDKRSRSSAPGKSAAFGSLLLRLDNSVVDQLTRSNHPIIAKSQKIQNSLAHSGARQEDFMDRLTKFSRPMGAESQRVQASPVATATIPIKEDAGSTDACFDTEYVRYQLEQQLAKQLANEKATQEKFTLDRKAFGSTHPATIKAHQDYVTNLNESLDRKRDVLELLEKHCGKQHPDTVEALKRYTVALSDLGREDEAKQWKKTLVEVMNESIGPHSTETLVAESNYAATLRNLGEYTEEEAIRKKVYEGYRNLLGEKHPDKLKAELRYANVLSDLGKYNSALPLKEEVHELSRQMIGSNNLDMTIILNSYADTLEKLGQEIEAEPLRKEALEISRTVLGAEHLDTIRALEIYAQLLCKLDREEGAEPLMKRVYDIRQKVLGADHQATIEALKSYAVVVRSLNLKKNVELLENLRTELSRHGIDLNGLERIQPKSHHQTDVVHPGNEIVGDHTAVMEDGYKKSEQITVAASKSFAMATGLMNENQKRAIYAIYTWCRRTDDLVDSPMAMMSAETMRRDLSSWRKRLYKLWRGEAVDSLDLALLDTFKNYPTLGLEPFFDMIEGMLMDTPQFGQDRYKTWDELYLYCYRVASTVGLMTLPIFGTAPGYTEEEAKDPAIALGIALQITNILRDVGEDARRGRIYLPAEDMKTFNVSEEQILNGIVDEDYINLMKFEVQRARDWYKKSHDGIPMLHKSSRLGVQAAGDIYSGILEKLEANNYDNFRKRAYVPKIEKFARLMQSWQTVSKMPEIIS